MYDTDRFHFIFTIHRYCYHLKELTGGDFSSLNCSASELTMIRAFAGDITLAEMENKAQWPASPKSVNALTVNLAFGSREDIEAFCKKSPVLELVLADDDIKVGDSHLMHWGQRELFGAHPDPGFLSELWEKSPTTAKIDPLYSRMGDAFAAEVYLAGRVQHLLFEFAFKKAAGLHLDYKPVQDFISGVVQAGTAAPANSPSASFYSLETVLAALLTEASSLGYVELLDYLKATYAQAFTSLFEGGVAPSMVGVASACRNNQGGTLSWWAAQAGSLFALLLRVAKAYPLPERPEDRDQPVKDDAGLVSDLVGSFVESIVGEGGVDVLLMLHDAGLVDIKNVNAAGAVAGGHLELAKMMYEMGSPLTVYPSHSAIAWAAQGGHLDTVKWLVEETEERWPNKEVTGEVLNVEDVQILEYLTDTLPEARKYLYACHNDEEHAVEGPPSDSQMSVALLDTAAYNGRLEILKWLVGLPGFDKDLGEVEYRRAVDNASMAGHLDVVEWLLAESGLTRKYTSAAFDGAASNGHVDVLKWWVGEGVRKHNLEVRYSSEAFNGAASHGYVNVVKWLVENSGLPLKVHPGAVDGASKNGHLSFLKWWKEESGLDLEYSTDAFDGALVNGHVEVLDWWLGEAGAEVRYTARAVKRARKQQRGNVKVWLERVTREGRLPPPTGP